MQRRRIIMELRNTGISTCPSNCEMKRKAVEVSPRKSPAWPHSTGRWGWRSGWTE